MERTTICQIDRFEGDVAVLVADGAEVIVSRSLIPATSAVGDPLTIHASGDPEAAAKMRGEISQLQQRLNNGDHLSDRHGESAGEGPRS